MLAGARAELTGMRSMAPRAFASLGPRSLGSSSTTSRSAGLLFSTNPTLPTRFSLGRQPSISQVRSFSTRSSLGGGRADEPTASEPPRALRSRQGTSPSAVSSRTPSLAERIIPNIPRFSVTQGPGILFQGLGTGEFRATVNTSAVHHSIAQNGFESGAVRSAKQVGTAPPTPIRDPDELRQEVRDYSGVVGKPPSFRGKNLVGTNANPAYTTEVAMRTSGTKPVEGEYQRELSAKGHSIVVHQVDSRGLEGTSVSGAFEGSSERPRHPTRGERVYQGTIPPSALTEVGRFPPSPGTAEERYAENFAKLTESRVDDPKYFQEEQLGRGIVSYRELDSKEVQQRFPGGKSDDVD